MACGRLLDLVHADPENPTLETNMMCIRWPIVISSFEFFLKMAGGRHLGFDRTGNSAIQSAVPESPTLEPKMKWIG